MRNVASKRTRNGLGYLALAALALQVALSVTSPGLAAWSPSHAHVSLDGREHTHVHLWDAGALGQQERIPGHEADDHAQPASQSEPAPAGDLGLVGGAIAIPAAAGLLAMAALAVLVLPAATPRFAGVPSLPSTPPPRG